VDAGEERRGEERRGEERRGEMHLLFHTRKPFYLLNYYIFVFCKLLHITFFTK
jgi:hypothetical protein